SNIANEWCACRGAPPPTTSVPTRAQRASNLDITDLPASSVARYHALTLREKSKFRRSRTSPGARREYHSPTYVPAVSIRSTGRGVLPALGADPAGGR